MKAIKALGYDSLNRYEKGRFVAVWLVDKEKGELIVKIVDTLADTLKEEGKK